MVCSPTSFAVWLMSSGVMVQPHSLMTLAAVSTVGPITAAGTFIAK
jgi:hypothetical protein